MAAGRMGSTAEARALPRDPTATSDGSGRDGRRATGARRRWPALVLPGAWGALLLACLSFTPSLLPRGGLFQGVLTGITAAIGYGLGVLAAWLWREVAGRPEPRPAGTASWRAFLAVAVVLLAVSVALGRRWQAQLRDLTDSPPDGLVPTLLMPVAAIVVALLLLVVARSLRAVYRRVAALLTRRLGARAARGLAWLLVVAATWGVASGVVLERLADAADRSFAVRDLITPEGIEQPVLSTRSGGEGSLLDWDSLGREGRVFIGRGPGAAAISSFTGEPALEPIRVFSGLGSADDVETRAELAVADLERAGGFEREALMVVTTTGSGWVSRSSVDSFEYLTGGDAAVVAMQYSRLPSWISYLVDQEEARSAGRELFDAVYERWSALPADARPRLFVHGESLGSFGAETAFSGEFDLANRTSGALFVGAPGFNPLHQRFTENRDPGTPQVLPEYREGRTVRFSDRAAEPVPPVSEPWSGSRVLYLQHASDPITWWNTDLLLRRPDWLAEERGRDVLDEMVWLPLVTFWQVTADLPSGTAVPAGHGHNFTGEHVDGWAAVLQPDGWSERKAEELRQIVAPGS